MFQKQDGLKVCFLVQLKPLFSPEDDPNQKRKKNIFKEKIQPWAFLAKKDGVQVKGSESKSNIENAAANNPGLFNMQKVWSQNFPNLQLLVPNDVSEKPQPRLPSWAAFPGFTPTFLKN